MKYCKCHAVLTLKEALVGLKDEIVEFVDEPSKDEASDIVYCLNRLAGTLTRRPILNVFPGGGIHIEKINERMNAYGCIRSKRHLIDGRCPSE